MNSSQNSEWAALEAQLHARATTFDYPDTPDIATAVQMRLHKKSHTQFSTSWVRLAASFLIIALIAFSVPEIRAAILDILQIGSVRIVPDASYLPDVEMQPLSSILNMTTETTLAAAETRMKRDIHLPEQLPHPDKIFQYDIDDREGVVIVWLNPHTDNQTVWFSLHLLDFPIFKIASNHEDSIIIGEQTALWLTQPHYLSYASDENRGWLRYIGGNVLIWYDGEITYRLEGNLTKETAIQIAEALQITPAR